MSLSTRRGMKLSQIRPDSPKVVTAEESSKGNPIQETLPNCDEVTMKDGVLSFSERFPVVLLKDLESQESLGRGASSTVIKVKHIPSGQIFALKRIRFVESENTLALIIREIHALNTLRHPNIVQLHTAFYVNGHIHILMALIDGGSLHDHIKISPRVPEPVLGRITWKVLQGLLYLRQKKYLHRDLKPSNILISTNGDVLIADFGLARQLTDSIEQAQSFSGTICYMSPERIKSEGYSFQSEIWSLGMIVYQCALGRFPYPGDPSRITFWDLKGFFNSDIQVILPSNFSPDLTDFLNICLKHNPADRASIEQLIGHPWAKQFSGIECDAVLLDWILSNEAKKSEKAKGESVSLKDLGIC